MSQNSPGAVLWNRVAYVSLPLQVISRQPLPFTREV